MRVWRCHAIVALSCLVLLAACSNRRSAPLPLNSIAPSYGPVAGGEPEATLTVSAERIEAGDQVKLTWTTLRADEAVLEPGAGPVPLNGTADVRPTSDTTYTLWARGPGGETTAAARVTVAGALPSFDGGRGPGVTSEDLLPPDGFTGTFEEEIARKLRDVYFDYDANEIKPDQMAVLDENAAVIQALFRHFPTGRIIVQGHCDERGSNEYNLALGDRRARASVDYLGQQGVPLGRLMLVSYGEEQQVCREANEACYSRNRRAHFAAAP